MVSAPDLLRFCEAELAWQIETIVELVRLESPSDEPAALEACARGLARLAGSLGARVSGADGDDGAVLHVRAELGHGRPRVLLLGHLDTVWPLGSLEIEEVDGRLHGPGIYDMKAGLAIALQAIRAVQAQGGVTGSVVLLCTIDEEIGSDRSRPLIELEARQADAVLVFEPALRDGGVKTGRKGVGDYRVAITGVAAHAGVEPALGASAIHELVRQAAIILALARPDLGTTVNIGVASGGSRTNVVAERAAMEVDIRVASAAEAARVDAAMRALAPADPRIDVTVYGSVDRPPMERSAAILRLYEVARSVAAELGDDLAEGATGGASDGNFTAALGVPTLDGLGAIGDGAHARHEHIRIDALARRTALVAGLIARLTTPERVGTSPVE
jgi:glutamate carboxypeptidase